MTKYLPKQYFTSDYVSLINTWTRCGCTLSAHWNSMKYAIEPFYVQNDVEVALTLQFEANESLVEFHFKRFPGLEFFDDELIGLNLDDFDDDLRFLILDIISIKATDFFSKVLGCNLTYKAMRLEKTLLDKASKQVIGLIAKPGKKYSNDETLFFHSSDQSLLHKLIKSMPVIEQNHWLNAPVSFNIVLSFVDLSKNDLYSLKCGDIVVIDKQHNIAENLIRIYYCNKYFACSVKNKTLITVLSDMEEDNDLPVGIIPDEEVDNSAALESLADSPDGNIAQASSNAEAELIKPSVDDLPIRVTFDIGEKIFTLAELKTIGAGYTFEIDRPVDECIKIKANGRCIASGELVSIHDRIGVRITQFK